MPGTEGDEFDRRIELARKLADQRQLADATTLFDWLCDTYPNRAAAFVDSANTFSRSHNYDGVEKRFAEIAAKPPVPPDVWMAMSQISRRLNRPGWVSKFLGNATSGVNPPAEACGLFARHLEREGNLDQADEWSSRGLKQDPSDANCQIARAKILRRRKDFDGALQAVDAILKNPGAPVVLQISAHHEAAHIRDAVDDCGGAIASLVQAKRLFAGQGDFAKFQQRSLSGQRTHHRFLTTLTPGYFKSACEWTPHALSRLALLAGHPRSGTTLLEQVLDSHSGIISAEETLVFSDMVNEPFLQMLSGEDLSQAALRVPVSQLESLRAAYFATMRRVLDQPLADRWLIDKNPSMTEAIPAFLRIFPEAKYIIALRDPRDVVLSCYFQDLPLNDVSVNFLTLAGTAMRYANTMAMWLVCRENMDESRWIEVRYESLVNDLPGEAGRVMRKLNLDWQPAQSRPDQHARSRSVVSPTYAEVRQPVHQGAVGKWRRYEPWLAEAMPALATFIEAFEYH